MWPTQYCISGGHRRRSNRSRIHWVSIRTITIPVHKASENGQLETLRPVPTAIPICVIVERFNIPFGVSCLPQRVRIWELHYHDDIIGDNLPTSRRDRNHVRSFAEGQYVFNLSAHGLAIAHSQPPITIGALATLIRFFPSLHCFNGSRWFPKTEDESDPPGII